VACPDNTLRLRNDLYCVGWGVKLYSLTHSRQRLVDEGGDLELDSLPHWLPVGYLGDYKSLTD